MTTQRIGFLIWPSTKALTLALAEEVFHMVHGAIQGGAEPVRRL